MKRVILIVLAIVMTISLLGCAGVDGHLSALLDIHRMGSITSHDRRNVDGSYGDVVNFKATRNGYVYIEMI